MSIRTRIFALVASFAVMSLAITGIGLMTISQYHDLMIRYGHAYEHTYETERLNHLVSNVVMESRGIYSAQSPAEVQQFATGLITHLDDMEGLMTQWQTSGDAADTARLEAFGPRLTGFITLRRQLAALAMDGKVAEARALGLSDRASRIRFQQDLDTMVTASRDILTERKAEADSFNTGRAVTFLAAALFSIALILVISVWLIMNFINRPLRHLAGSIITLSEGDLKTPLPETNGSDELSEVWRAVHRLKAHAIEAETVLAAQRAAELEKERQMREIILD